ncbi:putative transporter C11D3.18C [Lasiodiplodia hormozganensis]|uniref:Transporter C11D3.18C n=2 Tax=Lasiodiplodia TaxID=66739 RepID=A0AA39Z4V2_9PEZI|nr:putative transporter [Lasiodiplodia theobromae]KAK0663597.1 putative transporter C11D3.18C [Lasiodiplodia hormozganensis]
MASHPEENTKGDDSRNKDSSKAEVHHIDKLKDQTGPELPALLEDLSEDEFRRIEKKMVWKVDLRMLPLVIIMYILNYLDRNNIAAARLGGMEQDLNLVGSQYQTSVSILFVGYVLMQVPSNLLLKSVGKPALYLPTVMGMWGVVSGATGAVHNFAGLVSCRVLLGILEAAYWPGCVFYLSSWYTRKELGVRLAILFQGSLLSGAFSGLIAAGVLDGMAGVRGLASWRWLFIIEGTATVVVAILAIFLLPNFPHTTGWLSEQERQLAMWRLEQDAGETDQSEDDNSSILEGFKMAAKEIKVYVVAIMLICVASSASVLNFFPTVVETLGYGRTETLLLTAPPYVLCMFTSCFIAWNSDRTGERYFHCTAPLYFAIVAFVIAASTTAIVPRYISIMLMVPGFWSSWPLVFAWASSAIPRPAAKRAAALAMINSVANCANIFGSYLYPTSHSPRYILAMGVNTGTALVAILAGTVLRFILARENRKMGPGAVKYPL